MKAAQASPAPPTIIRTSTSEDTFLLFHARRLTTHLAWVILPEVLAHRCCISLRSRQTRHVDLAAHLSFVSGIDTTRLSDSSSARVILLTTLGLLVLGCLMIALTVRFWKSSQPDPDALGPLAQMSLRKFSKADAVQQRYLLDQGRSGLQGEEPVVDQPVDIVTEVESAEVEPAEVEPAEVLEEIAVQVVEIQSDTDLAFDDQDWPDLDDWSISHQSRGGSVTRSVDGDAQGDLIEQSASQDSPSDVPRMNPLLDF